MIFLKRSFSFSSQIQSHSKILRLRAFAYESGVGGHNSAHHRDTRDRDSSIWEEHHGGHVPCLTFCGQRELRLQGLHKRKVLQPRNGTQHLHSQCMCQNNHMSCPVAMSCDMQASASLTSTVISTMVPTKHVPLKNLIINRPEPDRSPTGAWTADIFSQRRMPPSIQLFKLENWWPSSPPLSKYNWS